MGGGKDISSPRCWGEWVLGAHRVAFLAEVLAEALLPLRSWESLRSLAHAPLALVCPARALPELPAMLLAPGSALAEELGW